MDRKTLEKRQTPFVGHPISIYTWKPIIGPLVSSSVRGFHLSDSCRPVYAPQKISEYRDI